MINAVTILFCLTLIGAGREHVFRAWRLKGESDEPVRLRVKAAREAKVEVVPDED